MKPVKLAIVGVGKIAQDQHIPSIRANPHFELVATASRAGHVEGVKRYFDIETMLQDCPEVEAVALCMPPQARHAVAYAALMAGKHVLLEKPPGATVAEVATLKALAEARQLTLFASWHSRYAAGVAAAKQFLRQHRPISVHIEWMEDVRRWHPGQEWIWQPGGLGVFDPGINALSIMTEILPEPVFLKAATLQVPSNRSAPIAADLRFEDARRLPVHAEFDWRVTGDQTWDIVIQTEGGLLRLAHGGAQLWINGAQMALPEQGEYPALYQHFQQLLASRRCDVDVSPLQHVADAFMLGRQISTDAFHEHAVLPGQS